MRRASIQFLIIFLVLSGSTLLFSPSVNSAQGKIYSLKINGAISPASADYFIRGLAQAKDNNADLLLLNLNTPGGLDKSMRVMIQAILDSPIPVVIYVSPKGARAASAGTYLMYASHIAAMAPATNLGSATPVSIGMVKPPSPDKKKDKDGQEAASDSSENADVMQRKVINDAEAYILSLAQLRGRNTEWAKSAVRRASNLSAIDALEKKVIDIVAYDRNALIEQLNQRDVKINQQIIRLNLSDPEIVEISPDWRTELLLIITDPSIAYLLLLAGIYGLMFEFLNPGSLLPGTIGAICILLALYGLNMLPINMAGLALIILGVALMVGEAFAPSFGVLGIGGVVAFIIGSFMLLDTTLPGYQIAPALIIASSLASAIIIIFVVSMLIRSRRTPLVSGDDELVNHFATALDDFDGAGRVMIRGEVWQADSPVKISKGQKVRVKAVQGLRLKVITED